MARRKQNKRKRVQGNVVPVPFASLAVAVIVLALGYTRLGTDSEQLGKHLRDLERQKATLARRVLTEQYQWSRMNSTASIQQSLRKHNMVMARPREDQIVRMLARDAGRIGSTGLAEGTESHLLAQATVYHE